MTKPLKSQNCVLYMHGLSDWYISLFNLFFPLFVRYFQSFIEIILEIKLPIIHSTVGKVNCLHGIGQTMQLYFELYQILENNRTILGTTLYKYTFLNM